MQEFGTADVARLADVPVATVRAMVRARYVTPTKGPRGVLRYSLQDVIVLRTARSLLAGRISPRRVGQALRSLQDQLPADAPAGGFSVTAVGDRVVVHVAGQARDALSGQVLMSFDVNNDRGRISLIDALPDQQPSALEEDGECDRAFEAALELEEEDVVAAIDAYAACVAKHAHNGARANLGRLLHLQGRISEAVALYEQADDPDADLLYNLAVALEDLERVDDAIAAYRRSLAIDDKLGDAHHNLSRLLVERGEEQQALRHWNAYRRLQKA